MNYTWKDIKEIRNEKMGPVRLIHIAFDDLTDTFITVNPNVTGCTLEGNDESSIYICYADGRFFHWVYGVLVESKRALGFRVMRDQ